MNFSRRVTAIMADPAKKARVDRVKNLVILHPWIKEVLALMEECMFLSQGAAEPTCMMLVGDTGVGKTVAIEVFQGNYPRADVQNVTVIPVLHASIPKPATIMGVVIALLKSLGAPRPESGTLPTKLSVLFTLLKSCRVRLIVLDEFQHLFEQGTARRLHEVSEWIKTLINQTGIPVVLCGMPSAEEVLFCNEQLKRRFRIRRALRPFDWRSDEDMFRDVLSKIDRDLPFSHTSNLAGDRLAARLWLVSRGNMANLMHLVQEAVLEAVLQDLARLEMEIFADVLSEELGDVPNPFAMTDAEVARMLQKECV